MNFEHIILEAEQENLFIRIVEKVRSIPRNDRMKMINIKTAAGSGLLTIPSQKSGIHEIKGFVDGDLDELSSKGFLRKSYSKKGGEKFVVSPEGFQFYDWLMKQQGKPVERIEKQTFRYLEFEDFRKAYPDAYRKVKQAEEMLWSADKEEQFTTIGHLCREAVHDFADSLYKEVMGTEYDGPKTQTNNRVETVIAETCDSKKVRKYLRSLFEYWKAVGGLIQKQEHRAEKEKEQLTWEDTRRVVFQTVNVMVELDRAVGKETKRR